MKNIFVALEIDPEVWKEAKVQAARQSMTLRAYIQSAIKRANQIAVDKKL